MEKKITKNSIKKAIGQCFANSDVLKITPYVKGNINRMFEIKLKHGKDVMLRVFNEDWKAKKEAFIYRDIAAHVDVPVPEVFYVDDSKKILPHAYTIMSKIKGTQIDESYKKYGNKKLFEKAGEALAKIHQINFSKFGWIMGDEIRPAFDLWRNFVWHDVELKLTNLKCIPKITALIGGIENYLNSQGYLLDIKRSPAMLHKDYHCSHILTDKDSITGIIDVEWAIAGHTENDLIKMELWVFNKLKDVRNSFFTGYLKNGFISDDYPDRKRIYELWHWINMVSISNEIKNRSWLDYNIKTLENFLKNEYHKIN